jgi:hypothetical protein
MVMTDEPTMVRVQFSGTRLARPVLLTLSALLLAGAAAARDDAGQGPRTQRPPTGPTTDAPSGNPVYRIADFADMGNRVKLQILWRRPMGGALVNVMSRGHVDNQLQVDPQARDPVGASPSAAARPADPWISTRVAASLRFDRTVDAGRVHVSTGDGVVTLSGWVPTAAEKRIAAEISGDIEDVKAVTNDLGIGPPPL